jgi:hypothetical protein
MLRLSARLNTLVVQHVSHCPISLLLRASTATAVPPRTRRRSRHSSALRTTTTATSSHCGTGSHLGHDVGQHPSCRARNVGVGVPRATVPALWAGSPRAMSAQQRKYPRLDRPRTRWEYVVEKPHIGMTLGKFLALRLRWADEAKAAELVAENRVVVIPSPIGSIPKGVDDGAGM